MTTKHTPGSWTLVIVKNGGDWTYDIRTEKPHNPAGGLGKHIAQVNKGLDPEGNGHLIAAAPDLWWGCKEAEIELVGVYEQLLPRLRDQGFDVGPFEDLSQNRRLMAVRAAIAKAERK